MRWGTWSGSKPATGQEEGVSFHPERRTTRASQRETCQRIGYVWDVSRLAGAVRIVEGEKRQITGKPRRLDFRTLTQADFDLIAVSSTSDLERPRETLNFKNHHKALAEVALTAGTRTELRMFGPADPPMCRSACRLSGG